MKLLFKSTIMKNSYIQKHKDYQENFLINNQIIKITKIMNNTRHYKFVQLMSIIDHQKKRKHLM